MRVALLHAYSAQNSGDGLLVREGLQLIRDAYGPTTQVTVFASYPESFRDLDVQTVRTKPNRRGFDRQYLRLLSRRLMDFDVLIGVGGGYLRGPTLSSWLKASIVMLPQLVAAGVSPRPSVYLPQSVGPFIRGGASPFLAALRRVDVVYVRDDRSIAQVPTARRSPDVAVATAAEGRELSGPGSSVGPRLVVNVREFADFSWAELHTLLHKFRPFDGLVQSEVASNSDIRAVASLGPDGMVAREDLYVHSARPRVVLAMRLHAALQALAAGHYVVHLAYERKGFGAFDDLNLRSFVHPARKADWETVASQLSSLLNSSDARARYDAALSSAFPSVSRQAAQVRRSLISFSRDN